MEGQAHEGISSIVTSKYEYMYRHGVKVHAYSFSIGSFESSYQVV